ncbi:2-amino-1-hydroxyethylphosphonate dioxygenase (glycine-forming)-like [Asterias rubens]|uniref:2-amino-1-hydroxyethylphosphonate dioxygenase (glycine-forming)-like n=1 Tax=Asterias rubens TaxID=7604 RepID=UPI0014555354|nr:2-amino-1-hydroxyethylphosphonate dioxygenase (glycine-forming)-like [Asterias rubens]
MDVDKTVEAIFDLYQRFGANDYIGEPVSQTEHMVQCAMLAEREGEPTEVILGALFHDIGHLVGMQENAGNMETDGTVLGIRGHEDVGQQFLEQLQIPRSVSVFAKGHVDAKRYLVYKDPGYYDRLSEASKMTLVHQGGPMTAEEARAFEDEPQLEAILKMRTWDERAKDPSAEIHPLERYQQMCKELLLSNAG